jgi:hypothetical protein
MQTSIESTPCIALAYLNKEEINIDLGLGVKLDDLLHYPVILILQA